VTTNPILAAYKTRAARDARGHAVEISWRKQRLGMLIPSLYLLDAADLDRLARWRNQSRGSFFSDEEVTVASTARWLDSAGKQADRLIFLIATEATGIVGHIGLRGVDEGAKTAETDAWLGVGDAGAPGIMFIGFATLLRWSFDFLDLERVSGRVFSDNASVVRAHEMLGYELRAQMEYAKHEGADGAVSRESAGPSVRRVSCLQLERAAFRKRSRMWS